MNNPSLLVCSLLVGANLLLGACGKSDKPAATSPAAAQPADGMRVVTITANDTMKFNLTEIRATPGEKLRIKLTNVGRMPKQSMAHNWVLLTPRPDAEVMSWGMAAASKAPTYLPADMIGVLAHTKLLGPGEQDSIEVTASATAGEYPFLCTFPGHVALMKGELIVN